MCSKPFKAKCTPLPVAQFRADNNKQEPPQWSWHHQLHAASLAKSLESTKFISLHGAPHKQPYGTTIGHSLQRLRTRAKLLSPASFSLL